VRQPESNKCDFQQSPKISKVLSQTQGSWLLVPDPWTGDIKRSVTQLSPGPWHDKW